MRKAPHFALVPKVTCLVLARLPSLSPGRKQPARGCAWCTKYNPPNPRNPHTLIRQGGKCIPPSPSRHAQGVPTVLLLNLVARGDHPGGAWGNTHAWVLPAAIQTEMAWGVDWELGCLKAAPGDSNIMYSRFQNHCPRPELPSLLVRGKA